MSEHVGQAPQLGERPWLSVGPCDVELNVYNGRSSTGLVATEFGALLFWQFFGHGTDFGLWLYLPVSDQEAEYIVDHPEEMMLDGLRERLPGRQCILALSSDGVVSMRSPYTMEKSRSHADMIRRMLEALIVSLSGTTQATQSHRPVEISPGSDKATAEAKEIVRVTLASCPS
ncbi:hypothetical protein [Lentzea sp.]|uniref:hypothetical protein n=1 Tax=Lentzea sp. TaxID=56099 RepID=UPI002ED18895